MSDQSRTIYCIDAGTLIWAATEAYPFDVAPWFWKNLEKVVSNGQVVSTIAQLDEIKDRDDELHAWARSTTGLFMPIDQHVADKMPTVMDRCAKLINPIQKKDEGDPYLVSFALVKGGTVVTEETPNNNDNQRIKIPDACRILRIPCIKGLNLVRQLKLLAV